MLTTPSRRHREAPARRPLDRPLRIGLLSPVWFAVPPLQYGGIESVVALLADGLTDAGHDVTLFASGDSRTRARLEWVFERAPSERIGQTFWELQHLVNALVRQDEFDVLHDHTGLLGVALGSLLPTPLVHTVHGPLTGEPGDLYERVVQIAPRANPVSLSMNQRRPKPNLRWLANVPNAIDLTSYAFSERRGDYLLFLGRMSPDKGAHVAARLAAQAGLPLKMAGKNAEPEEQAYFAQQVQPHLGADREYLGEVGHTEKLALIAGARATLCPIDWEEPFGLVLIESMACGTPVIATRRGAVPEIIDDGGTGIIVDHWNDLGSALQAADRLNPHDMRTAVEERFSPQRMIGDYITAYHRALAASPSRARASSPLARLDRVRART